MNSNLAQYLPLFLLPFILSLVITPLIRRFAIKQGFISYPRADRWHKHPTALLGGVSIYLASVIAVSFLGGITKNVLGLFIGATFLFIAGLFDDKSHLMPYTKLFMQIIAGCVAIFFGVTLGLPINKFLAIPLTLLWIVGVTNSFNLLDNIDGLASGIAAISSLMLFFSSLVFSNNPLAIYSLILSGAALGFLPYNFNPAKIFMGDSGSMFLGYSLAVISIAGTPRHISGLLITMLIPVFILSVPIFDTIFVMVVRRIGGRKIFEGGQDHTSHHLVTLGLSPKKTVLLLYLISIVFGLIAILYSRVNLFVISTLAFLASIILVFLGIYLFDVTKQKGKIDARGAQKRNNHTNYTVLNTMLMYKRRVVEVLLDFFLICIAYYSAYFLRFEGSLLANNIHLLEQSLGWIIFIKMSVFFMFGLYRGVWRYMGISDFITMFKVVTLGTIASVLFLTFAFRFYSYSRAVFFIDWLILLFLVTGSRFLFRLIGEFFSKIQNGQTKILIFGAGDTGEMVAREIKRNKSLNYNPIGFIDDDPYKAGNKIHGIPILGSREKIKDLVKMHDIKEIIIAMPSINKDSFSEITRTCEDCGLIYRKIKGILDKEDTVDFRKE